MELLETDAVRMLLGGYPGSGKSGSLASLINAGFKVRVLNFEGKNGIVGAKFADRAAVLANLDVITLADNIGMGAQFMQPVGIPAAFDGALKALKDWKTTDGSLGPAADWGPDTILVIDSMTTLSEAIMNRARVKMNKTPTNMTQQVWGLAREDLRNFIKVINADSNRFHVIVMSHLQMIAPTAVDSTEDTTDQETLRDIARLLPTRIYPIAMTKNQSQTIAGGFSSFIRAEKVYKNGKEARVLKIEGGEEIDLKLPTKGVSSTLPIESGLLTIFEALGFPGPNKG